MRKFNWLWIAFLLAFPIVGNAQISNKVGTSGFQFLKIGVGARENALGQSGIAFTRGPDAIYWNVAGLTQDTSMTATFFVNPWIATINHSFFAVNIPVGDNNFVGAAVTLLSMDDMEETTIDNPQGTGRHFGAGDFAVSLSYSLRISEQFSGGVTAKYINEHIWDMVSDGWGFDVGLLYVLDRFHIGAALKNFGSDKPINGAQLQSNQQVSPDWATSPVLVGLVPKGIRLPMSFDFGAGYEVIDLENHQVLAMGDISYFNDIGETQNLGVEYTLQQNYSIRVGYRFNQDLFSVTGGLGVKVLLGDYDMTVDFAAVNMGDFGYRTQFGLTVTF